MSLVVTVVAPAAPPVAWSLWSDVGSWPVWNPECVSASLDGPAAEGTVLDLTLRHPRGREFITRPRVSAVAPGSEFSWETRGLGFRATTATTFVAQGDGTLITLRGDTTGPLAFTYRMTMTDRMLAVLYTRMLDALVAEVRP